MVSSPLPLRAFAQAGWYSDPTDPRCPCDASLESLEISEPRPGRPDEMRHASITVKLLGAYRDGWIVLTYSDVGRHNLASYHCDQGIGSWLRDEFSQAGSGLITHRITWSSQAAGTSQWIIEATAITYEWRLK